MYYYRRIDTLDIFYIGRARHKSISSKYIRAGNIRKHNTHCRNVANKYGWFYEIVIDNINYEQSIAIEKYLICIVGIDNLTNITLGGEGTIGIKSFFGHKHTDETKRKMSIAQRGKIISLATRQKYSLIHSGNTYNLGMKRTDEQKENIRNGQLNSTKIKGKPIVCIDLSICFLNATFASLFLGLNKYAVSTAMRKGYNAGGYKFEYI